jgi:hypothetical protein
MQMKLAKLVLFIALLATAPAADSQFTFERLDLYKKSVVRVDGTNCSGQIRLGTGFFWRQNTWVVTTLHVVNGCESVAVFSESTGRTRRAKIAKVLRREDLALLEIDAIEGVRVADAATQLPEVTEDLEALGYPLGIPKIENTTLRLRYGGKKLRDIIPKAVADALGAAGSPSPDIDVTNIEGHLQPGSSGSPILNRAGQVVAIGDGGLENGAAGASWALPVVNLPRLPASPDSAAPVAASSNPYLFAAEFSAKNGPDVTCGGATFKQIRTLKFGDIMNATDDPLGLQQILAASGPAAATFTFDVYQQISSGATFAVPAGYVVHGEGPMCAASSESGNVVIQVQLIAGKGDPNGQMSSVEYEASIGKGQNWQPDPGWTYPIPIQRFDGFVVRRRSYVRYSPGPMGWAMDASVFETLIFRNGVFLGASALERKWSPAIAALQAACKFNPNASSDCAQALKDFDEWARAGLAVHLATFPVG